MHERKREEANAGEKKLSWAVHFLRRGFWQEGDGYAPEVLPGAVGGKDEENEGNPCVAAFDRGQAFT
jgi:hypothetical protein